MRLDITRHIESVEKIIASHQIGTGQYRRWLWQDKGGTRNLDINEYEPAFEKAAELRDRYRAIELLGKRQKVVAGSLADTDVAGFHRGEAKSCFVVLHFVDGELAAKDIAAAAKEVGWSKTTTYTVLKKCVDKGLVQRLDPGFLCRALVSREDVQRQETRELIERMYGGHADRLVASLLEGRALSSGEIDRLRKMVEELP